MLIGGLIAVALGIQLLWGALSRSKGKKAMATVADMAEMGDVIPASIHPVVDPSLCMGSGACVAACPEHDVIGLLRGRAHLINPLGCIGHGACLTACPVDAIDLVFGTAHRGIELPVIDAEFQTNREGVYVVGELGGMGLIRNAVRQGKEVGEYIAAGTRRGGERDLDVVVVGAGPAGISATLQLMKEKLKVVMLEREDYGGTITHYPRKKIVMSGELDIPLYGKVKKRTMSKEALLALFLKVRNKTKLPFRSGELVEALSQAEDGHWVIHSTSGKCRAANVVLALGRRGAPRKLGVPGEDLHKVHYRLLEPEVFAGQHMLVVGGGNAAAECALALADDGGCASVALSYRRGKLARCRREVRERVEELVADGRIRALMPSQVVEISGSSVKLTREDKDDIILPNDAVIVQIGGTPPVKLLTDFGLDTVVKRGEA